MVKYGNVLKRVRILRRMTQDELAAASGLWRKQIRIYEANFDTPPVAHARKLAKALNTDYRYWSLFLVQPEGAEKWKDSNFFFLRAGMQDLLLWKASQNE